MKRDYEYVEGWGMAVGAQQSVLRPRSVDEVHAAFELARREGASLGLRGAGCSYGDASVNERGYALDLSGMNRILNFDPASGVAELETGVSIAQLWKTILPLGWWPRVVSGTMFPTMGGAAAMNIHGKNNYAVGSFGDAILEFDLVTPAGELLTCSRSRHADLFHAAIGGLGMLGAFTRVKLATKHVHSGDLEVRAYSNRNLAEMMEYFEAHKARADYLVGWIDCFGKGEELGRGLVHNARYLAEGEDREPHTTLRLEHQELPANILGLLPKSEVWRLLAPFVNDPGMRLINFSKVLSGRIESLGEPRRQSHAAFAFLLDYVPNWKWSYGAGGLIQYQSFLPAARAHEVYTQMLEHCHRRGIVPYLGVFKRHRPDPFWLTHALDGWSFAMDFRVTQPGRAPLWQHCAELTEMVLAAGGKFYFAKDLVLAERDLERIFPAATLAAFRALKRQHDPLQLLETNLWRRMLDGRAAPAAGAAEATPAAGA